MEANFNGKLQRPFVNLVQRYETDFIYFCSQNNVSQSFTLSIVPQLSKCVKFDAVWGVLN